MRKLVLLALVLFGPTVAAQTPPPAPAPAQPPAPIEREVTPPADVPGQADQDDYRRFRFRPIVRVAQDYTLPAGDSVWEIQSVFGDVVINGRVEQDVVVVMGSVRVGPTAVIDGSLAVIGGSATIEEGAVVRDDLVVVGGALEAPATFSPHGQHIVIGSPWVGETLQGLVPWITSGLLWGRLIVPDIDWVWVFVGVFFLLYLALNTVFDRPVSGAADVMVRRPISVFMIGLLVLLLTGPITAIVAASVIGLAVVPFILCAVIGLALIGKTAVARAIGRSVMRTASPESGAQATGAFLVGFALLTLAYMVPIIGFLTWALTTVLGLGAATVSFRALLRRERPVPDPAAMPVIPAGAPVAAAAAHPGSVHAEPAHYAGRASPLAPPPVDATTPPPPSVYTSGLAQYPRASFLDRLAAFVLDCVLVAIANAILDVSRNDGFFFLLLLVYHIAFWAWKGTTLGGIITNLRVIRTHGAELRPADAVVRGLSGVFSLAALGIGCLWMLQDPERQMWHDKIAGTLVVKVPKELVLP